MTWNPRLKLQPVSKFRDNVITYMQAHIEEALEWAAAQCGLDEPPPTPVGWYKSLGVREHRPVVNVLTMGADPTDDDDGNREESKRLTIEVERTAADSDKLIEVLEPYTLAFTSMIMEMEEEDWWQGMSTQTRGDLDVTAGRERYSGRTYESEKVFLQVGSVEVTISYIEERGD